TLHKNYLPKKHQETKEPKKKLPGGSSVTTWDAAIWPWDSYTQFCMCDPNFLGVLPSIRMVLCFLASLRAGFFNLPTVLFVFFCVF
ncbi:MAG: hypothetical protein LIP02_10595, partial [Bacteroidales bacterium]|nr:hypothetical protein [Bacteroidales bacterium]